MSQQLPRLAAGERFAAVTAALARRGARDPKALAAFIGRRKLGKQKFQQLAEQGRRASMATVASKHPNTGRFQRHGAPTIDDNGKERR